MIYFITGGILGYITTYSYCRITKQELYYRQNILPSKGIIITRIGTLMGLIVGLCLDIYYYSN